MALSFRGRQVDMVSLAKKNEKVVALGNAGMNGRGDILGKGGKIVKTREEVLADWYATHTVEKDVKNLKETVDNTTGEIVDETVEKDSKKPFPKYEDINDEEKEMLKRVKK
nr:MAG TPA: hypothetical protein [Caudoviricetes sp.]